MSRWPVPPTKAVFAYGALKGDWQPMNNAQLVRAMADHIAERAPPGTKLDWLR